MPTITGTPPADLPRWADGASGHSASVSEPTELKKDTGWVAPTPPSAAEFNWYQNLVYQWVAYIDPSLTELDVGKFASDGSQEFDGDFIPATDGNNLGEISGKRWDAYLNALLVASGATFAANITVVGDILAGTNGSDIGASAGNRFDAFLRDVNIGRNCAIDTMTSNLIADVNGRDLGDDTHRWDAFLDSVEINSLVVEMFSVDTIVTDLISDTGSRKLGSAAKPWQSFLDTATMDQAGTTSATTAVKNKLLKELIPKTWVTIFFDVGMATVTRVDGMNVTSVSIAAGIVTVNIAEDMADANYGVFICADTGAVPPLTEKIASRFKFNTAGYLTDNTFSCMVMGRQ